MTVGDKIRLFGKTKFGSIKNFSEKMEMHPSNLQVYMKNISSPGFPILCKLSKLGCSIDWLLDDDVKEGDIKKEKSIYQDQIDTLTKENKKLRKEIKRLGDLIGGE